MRQLYQLLKAERSEKSQIKTRTVQHKEMNDGYIFSSNNYKAKKNISFQKIHIFFRIIGDFFSNKDLFSY